jgi:fructokinase
MVVCCGENLIDMVPAERNEARYGSFEACPGGCPYNSAIALARLGTDVAFLGRTASDFLGDKLFDRLKSNNVDVSMISRTDEPVTLAFVEKEPNGDVRYAFYANGAADRSFSWDDVPPVFPANAAFLLIGSISITMEPSASTILRLAERESVRILISFDPNVRPSLIHDKSEYRTKFEKYCSLSAIVKASDSDLEWIYDSEDSGKIVERILDLGTSLVVLTRGAKGSFASTRNASAQKPAYSVPVVDTIGAGDTFHAAVLSALDKRCFTTRTHLSKLDSRTLGEILEFASAAAALDCMKKGAEPPTMRELLSAYPSLGGLLC